MKPNNIKNTTFDNNYLIILENNKIFKKMIFLKVLLVKSARFI